MPDKKIVINKPMQWDAIGLSEATKSLFFEKDEEGNIKATPVILVDPSGSPTTLGAFVQIKAIDINSLNPAYINAAQGSYNVGDLAYALITKSVLMVQKPSASGNENVRTPDTFKWALCTTAAATTVWDPGAGKKFRLMGGVICPDGGLAAAGIQKISLLDEAADAGINFQTYLPIAASIAHQHPIVFNLGPNGYLSSTADNMLKVTLTSACTAGGISVTVWGTEE